MQDVWWVGWEAAESVGKWEVLLERVAYREPRVLLEGSRLLLQGGKDTRKKTHEELGIISSLPMNSVFPQCSTDCAMYS